MYYDDYKRSAKSLYEKGVSTRNQFEEIARDNAAVTIPYLFPDFDYEKNTEFDSPYQSLGGRGVNHLASQLLNILFPTNQPYFRLTSDLGEDEIGSDPELSFQVESALQKIEKTIVKEIDKRALRSSLYNALRLLITTGTVVISFLDDSFRVLRLNQFVVKRHPDRKVKYVIYKDEVTRDYVRKIAPQAISDEKKEYYELYTTQYFNDDGTVKICQEIEEERIVEEELQRPAIFVVTSNILDEEDYGRSIVEELQGDLYTLERLSESVAQSAAIASKHVYLVDPAGALRGRDLAEAATGDVISGRATDVTVLQSQKQSDLGIVFNHIAELKDRLTKAFLLTAESFPDRQITATEARARVAEIEASLGGVYSQLSQTLQLPFLNLMIQNLEESRKIPKLPEGVAVNIITGLDLLDRKSKISQVEEFLALATAFGPEVMSMINVFAILKEVALSIGLDVETYLQDPNEAIDPGEGADAFMQQAMGGMMQGTVAGMGQGMGAGVQQAVQEQIVRQAAGQALPTQ